MKFLVLFLCFTQIAQAQISLPPREPLPTEGSKVVPEVVKPEVSPIEKTIEEAKPVATQKTETSMKEIRKGALTSRENRDASIGTVMVGYQLITSWIPSKKTIGYTHIFNENWSLEGEFSFSKISGGYGIFDLGEVKERRYTLQARRYVGNSFHFSFGPVVSEFEARAGSDILDNFGNGIRSDFSARNLGLTGGLGNRWQWSNGVTFGVDWIRVNIPFAELSVEDNVLDDIADVEEQEDVKKIIRTFNRIPTFVLLGVNLGYTF